ncbi:putative phosphohydrolase [Bradyrhizobium sp. USDA 4341]
MRIWVESDRHFEQSNTVPKPPDDYDVLVCPGDLNYFRDVVATLRQDFYGDPSRPRIYVPGNHDYYRGVAMEDADTKMRFQAFGTNIHVLNPGTVVIDGVRFVGATLWTDFRLFGLGTLPQAMAEAEVGLNDSRKIRTYENRNGKLPSGTRFRRARRFTPEHAMRRHERERRYLEKKLQESFDGPTVVVTHHGISPLSVPTRFKSDPLSPAFSSDLTSLVNTYQPTLWLHGHVHDSFDYRIGSTRVVCNPTGYNHEPNPQYREGFVIDLDRPIPVPTPTGPGT